MSHTQHELTEDFPNSAEKIHALKLSDHHFARLVEDYHQLNRRIHRAETNIEPIEQMAETTLRKERAALKDQIARILTRA